MSPLPLTSLDIVDNIISHPNSRQSLACASLVCKAWNTLYTPALWRPVCYNYSHVHITPPDFEQHGVHVRRLEVESLNDYLPEFIAARHCPFIEILDLMIVIACPRSWLWQDIAGAHLPDASADDPSSLHPNDCRGRSISRVSAVALSSTQVTYFVFLRSGSKNLRQYYLNNSSDHPLLVKPQTTVCAWNSSV